MPDQVQTAPAGTDQRNPQTVAGNISKAIHNRANGTNPPAAPPATETKATETAADPNAGKEKYVVEGREVWLTPQERTAWIQKGMAFEPRIDELARLKQETLQLQRALLQDPGRILENLAKQSNVSMKEMVQRVLKGRASDEVKEVVGQWYYENAVEPLKLSPEQLKAREDAKWRQEREENDKRSAELRIQQENQQRVQAALIHLKAQIAEAMKESGLANNDTPLGIEMASRVARVMLLADKQKRPMTPKQAIEIVKNQQIKAVQQAYYESLADKEDDGETLVSELGEKIVAKIQKHLLKKAQQNGANPPVVSKKPIARSGERQGVVTLDDFHDYLDNLKKKG